jgi:hypothetical protein
MFVLDKLDIFDSMLSICLVKEKFEDTKGVIRSGKSKDRQYNGQKKKEKQRLTKQYTEN